MQWIFHRENEKDSGILDTYEILVRVYVYLKAILFAFPQYADGVVYEVVVVDATSPKCRSQRQDTNRQA